jgi:predicted nucleic acid-binding Zn ribbon protein
MKYKCHACKQGIGVEGTKVSCSAEKKETLASGRQAINTRGWQQSVLLLLLVVVVVVVMAGVAAAVSAAGAGDCCCCW